MARHWLRRHWSSAVLALVVMAVGAHAAGLRPVRVTVPRIIGDPYADVTPLEGLQPFPSALANVR